LAARSARRCWVCRASPVADAAASSSKKASTRPGYHLNCSRQLVGGIPERVSDTTRLDEIASLGRLALLICDADANRARGHVRLLILVGVDVRRRQAMPGPASSP
jgi:hypothetical protein